MAGSSPCVCNRIAANERTRTELGHSHTCQPPSKKGKDYASKNSGFYVKSRDAQIVLVTEE